MKKIFIGLIAVTIILSCLVSCNEIEPGEEATDTTPIVTEPSVTEPPVTEPPVTEPPVTEPPVTEPLATEPPVTEPPVTEPPVTEPPVTEPPVTEPPVTEPPATEPPATEPPATEPPATEPQEPRPYIPAAANPIGNFEFEKFIPEDKNDKFCTVGFVLQANKYTYRGNDIVLLHITNTTDTDYGISLTMKYLDSDGKTIQGLRDKYTDFGAGWDNYYVYDPDFSFDSFSCSLSISTPCKNSVTKYLTNGENQISFSLENSGYYWLDRQSGRVEILGSPKVAVTASFSHTNASSDTIHYIADYIILDKDGTIIFYDKSRVPGVALAGNNSSFIPVYLSNTRWSQKGNAKIPDEYSDAVGIVAYVSVLNTENSITDGKKAKTDEFGYYTFAASNGVNMPYRLFLPRNYDPAKKYPVVTIFHANGSQGSDNELQLRDVEKFFGDEHSPIYDCIVFAPQCPLNGWWLGENIDAAVEILDFINANYSTDKSRQYITGTSMGGCATWNMLSRYPEKVSAAVPCAYYGGFGSASEIDGPVSLSGQLVIPREMLQIPIYYIYSDADETISPDGCRTVAKALKGTGMKNFTYSEEEGQSHGNLGATYISKYNGYEPLYWLLDQRRETE